MTERCPETGKACSTAYNAPLRCRCSTCKEWNKEHSERQRRKRGDRVQLRKQEGATWCPVTGKTAANAYSAGCRCSTCRKYRAAYNRQRTVRRINERARREGRPFTDAELRVRDRDLWAAMEYAILNDVEFVIEIAKKCAAIAAEHEAENGVSA